VPGETSTSGLEELRQWFNDLPSTRHLFITCSELGPGTALVEMEPPDDLRNPNGAVGGLVLAGFADLSGGIAVASVLADDEYAATIDLNLHFMRPVHDVPARAQSEVLRRGRSHAWLRVRVLDATGVDCILATGTWAIYPIGGEGDAALASARFGRPRTI
jgi:uncharacterized protein (TIGR00369 family)